MVTRRSAALGCYRNLRYTPLDREVTAWARNLVRAAAPHPPLLTVGVAVYHTICMANPADRRWLDRLDLAIHETDFPELGAIDIGPMSMHSRSPLIGSGLAPIDRRPM